MDKNETIIELLSRGVSEVIDHKHLESALKSGKKLRVKLGIDPTGSRLHLGHAVVLRILRRFQDLGHTAVLIIGDTTASIGDPSGKNETRPSLSAKDIIKNFETYERQALKVLDKSLLELHWQSEWFKKFNLNDLIAEASKLSVGWIMSHETFRKRLENGQPLALHELLYPLVQAYDSVAVKADVELGGLDQKFNLLTGRELMRAHELLPQDIVLGRYFFGPDGQKMGKSLGNLIALEDDPFEMFGKIMSVSDPLILEYFELATTLPMEEVKKLEKELKAGTNPRTIKVRLAKEIVTLYHGTKSADSATISLANRTLIVRGFVPAFSSFSSFLTSSIGRVVANSKYSRIKGSDTDMILPNISKGSSSKAMRFPNDLPIFCPSGPKKYLPKTIS